MHLYTRKVTNKRWKTKEKLAYLMHLIWSPSTEAHVDVRPTYSGVRHGFPRRLFTTLQFLPKCHATFSNIPSNLAWVDQSPVNQRVL
jgi:hypothetical protein